MKIIGTFNFAHSKILINAKNHKARGLLLSEIRKYILYLVNAS